MTSRWTFFDSVSSTTYSFELNPLGDSPSYVKNLQFQAAPNQGAAPLLFEGADQPTTFSATGTILTESQYNSMLFFYELRRKFQLTDDLGRVRMIYLTNFKPVRVRSALFPWKHTYTLSGYTVSETLPVPPVLTSLSPAGGGPAGGMSVTITGTGFAGATAVTWNGSSIAFTIVNDSTITVTAPSGSGAESVTVTSSTGTSFPSTFTYSAIVTLVGGNNASFSQNLLRTTDGHTYTYEPTTADGGDVTAIAWNGSKWMICGFDHSGTNVMETSTDGITWTAGSLPTAWSGGSGIGALATNGSLWVACQRGLFRGVNYIASSPDGSTWTEHPNPLDGYSGPRVTKMIWVAHLGAFFLGVTHQVSNTSGVPNLLKSTDGTTWTVVSCDFDGTSGTGSNRIGVYDIAYNSSTNTLILSGISPDGSYNIDVSTDGGSTWIPHLIGVTGMPARCVATNGSIYVAGLDSSNTHTSATSSDGSAWTIHASPFDGSTSNNPLACAWDGSQFILGGTTVSGARIATSTDGTTWTQRSSPFDPNGSIWGAGTIISAAT